MSQKTGIYMCSIQVWRMNCIDKHNGMKLQPIREHMVKSHGRQDGVIFKPNIEELEPKRR